MSEEFWGGLILAAAYLGCQSVCINALVHLRFAKAINDRSACSIFNYIPDLHDQEMHSEVASLSKHSIADDLFKEVFA